MHQINHFHDELLDIAVGLNSSLDRTNPDVAWEALGATRGLIQ